MTEIDGTYVQPEDGKQATQPRMYPGCTPDVPDQKFESAGDKDGLFFLFRRRTHHTFLPPLPAPRGRWQRVRVELVHRETLALMSPSPLPSPTPTPQCSNLAPKKMQDSQFTLFLGSEFKECRQGNGCCLLALLPPGTLASWRKPPGSRLNPCHLRREQTAC